MFMKIHACCFALLMCFSTVGGASISINPSSMVFGSSTANPVTRLEVQCNSDGISNIETVYRLEISRRRCIDPNFVSIAAVDAYRITKSFPADMKSPNATGSLVSAAAGEPPTSGRLVVTMDGGGLTCSDQAEFKCTMTYQMIGAEATPPSSDSNNFTVITAPNDVRIIDALYEENGVELQLANNSILKVGTRIKYRCTANTGSDSTAVISWERSPVMGTSTDLVPYIPADSTDIVQDPVVSTCCFNTRTSSMYYNLTSLDDDGVTFRCKVRSYLGGNWYESISIQRRTVAVPGGGSASGRSVGAVTMTLNPQLMVVGSSTSIPVTMLEMRCSSDGTSDIQYLIQMKILRRKFTETSFTGIASWNFKPGSLNGDTQLSLNLPQDILSRTPNASASIDPSQKSGVLVVTMNGQGLTCSNQAEFNCSLSYMDLTFTVRGAGENKNFTVTATPNDVLMDSAEYYDYNGNTLQLTNNMPLNVGTRIKYKCTANIGSIATGEIIWDRSPQLQGSNTPFILYTPTIATDIVQDDPQLQQDGCSYKRISTMYYNLTSNDDDGITFRCRARSYLGSQWYEAVSNQQYRTVAVLRGSGWNSGALSGTISEADVIAVGGASITINPSSMVVGSSSAIPVTRLEVQCKSGELSNIEVVYRLEISRRRFGDPNFVNIAAVDAYKITRNFPADMKSPNATGGLVSVAAGEPPTSGTLVVTMDGGGLACSDQAEFKCTMIYKMIGDDVTPPSSDSNNFTVITAPNDVRIMDALYEENGIQLQLANDSKLNVGTRIKYRCTANIGSDSTVLISWERSPVMGTSTDLVPYIPAEPTDIVQDPVISTSCSNTRTSSMYYNMTNSDDDGVTFRCKVRSNFGGNWYESISIPRRTFAVRTSGTGGGNASAGLSGSPSQAGVIAGAVIGAIAGVVLLIVLVYFLWYRKRSSGESYRTKEEGERPEPPPTDYTYSMPDKKKVDGYDNKGLEEPHEKKTRYPRSGRGGFDGREGRNDGGHHNPGMDDEDGGTMHMSHGPIGTGV